MTESLANLAGHSKQGASFIRELFQVFQRDLAALSLLGRSVVVRFCGFCQLGN